MNRPKRSIRDPRLITGVALIVGSILVGHVLMSSAGRTSAVWVTTHDMPAGSMVQSKDLIAGRVHLGDLTARYASGGSSLVGSVVTRDLVKGELVPASALKSARARLTRLVTVPVEQFHAPAGLARGDLVDVYINAQNDSGLTSASSLVAARVAVHSIEDDGGTFGSSSSSVGVVLELAPENVARVVTGVRQGAVDLVRVPLDSR
ncbi:unannotated protein [freshwater metagenome]|jgi:hypothetical protein|uniref:Unannotated protein n=1 Tax=freshwater metagenome TaxID=449393 RepID=A0A6J7DQ40_9ZZZZ